MSRARLSLASLAAFVIVLASCTDRPAPTEAASAVARRAGAVSACLSLGDLTNLVSTVFGAGGPNANSALSKLNTITRKLADGDTAAARQHARDLISFIQQKATQLANPGQVQALIDAIECYAGITNNAFLVFPLDAPQIIKTSDGQAGIKLPADPVTEPTLITLTMLDPSSSGVLNTKLDKYPGYVEIQQQSSVTNSLKAPVTVAVCPAASVPSTVRSRLRLGHQSAVNGFEITPQADGSFLTCSAVASNDSKLKGWVSRLASLVLPKPLYAYVWDMGGIGGTATEFSPFGPVDTELSFTGGIGGTATEFIRQPADTTTPTATAVIAPRTMNSMGTTAPSTATPLAIAHVINCGEALVGASLSAECRPRVTMTTYTGTILQNVPVTWTIGQGGGQVAMDSSVSRTCGAFGSTASTKTNVNGKAGACWTLGPVAGVNTLTATPTTGGDVPPGVTFTPANNTFTVNGLKKAATLTLSGLSQVYSGSPITVSATTTPADLATVSITYDGSATAPTNAGTYAVLATLDNPSWQGTASGSLVITKATQAALSITALTAPAVYNTSMTLQTTGGTGDGAVSFVGSGACTASGNTLSITSGTGTCTVVATKSGGTNYGDVSATMSVAAVQAEQAAFSITGAATVAFGGADVVLGTSGGSGAGAVTFDAGTSSACTVTSAGSVHATTGTGSCVITATKAADANYTMKTAAPFAITITKARATLTLGNLSQVYTGAPKSVSVATTPVANLETISVTYNGSSTPPSAGGDYAVVATLANADYDADAAIGTLSITKAPQSISFDALGAKTYGDADFAVSASASSGLAVSFSASGTCSVSGATVSIAGAGSCSITAHQGGDGNYQAATDVTQSFTINKAVADVTLGNLAAVYTGSTINATVATTATGSSAFTVTYNGSPSAPVNAGSYSVSATLNNDNFSGSASGTLVISKAPATLTLSNLAATYNGAPKSASVTTAPVANLGAITITYDGSPAAPTNAGNYAVVATLDNPNYYGSASGTLVIGKAPASIFLGALNATYDGNAKSVTTSTSPSGLTSVDVTYNGGASAPVNAGTYMVVATLNNANYVGSVSGNLVITPAASTITWVAPANISLGTPLSSAQLNAAASTMGSFAYTPPAGTVLPAGPSTLSTLFTPSTANFSVATASVSINVRYVQVGCFSSPIYNVMPDTKSYQRKGSNLQIKCQLTNAQGVGVMNATGNLQVEDRGTAGTATDPAPLVINNAFKVSTSGNYAYGLDTSPAKFISLHYYRVTAFWNDGSSTVGWFYIK